MEISLPSVHPQTNRWLRVTAIRNIWVSSHIFCYAVLKVEYWYSAALSNIYISPSTFLLQLPIYINQNKFVMHLFLPSKLFQQNSKFCYLCIWWF